MIDFIYKYLFESLNLLTLVS